MTTSSSGFRGASRPLEALIDVDAVKRNFDRLSMLGGQANCVAVVKSDGYGHGLTGIIDALPQARQFALATANELDRLSSVTLGGRPVLLLEGFFDLHEPERVRQLGFCAEWVVHSHWQLDLLESRSARLASEVRVWIKINTGMNRLGFRPEDLGKVFLRLSCLASVSVLGIVSHLACADIPDAALNLQQFECFDSCHAALLAAGHERACVNGRLRRSLLNSAGLLQFPEKAYDQVRPGISMYGALDPVLNQAHGLSPVMTLRTRLIAVQHVQAGDRIGYGGDYVAAGEQCIGIVAAGYGDGYPRQVSTCGQQGETRPYVLVKGKPCRLVGRCSMDMLTVDLGPSAGCEFRPGDPVELWGRHLPIELVAGWASTISYHLLTGVTQRVPRRYIEGSDPANEGAGDL